MITNCQVLANTPNDFLQSCCKYSSVEPMTLEHSMKRFVCCQLVNLRDQKVLECPSNKWQFFRRHDLRAKKYPTRRLCQ